MSEATEFLMPTLGADMEKGTLLEWFVKPGDAVHRGQVVAEIDTEKSAIEIEVFTDGIVEEICVSVGQEVPVGTVLARLQPAEVPAPPAASGRPPASGLPVATTSPLLRHLAEHLDVDVAAVTGTGAGGKVTRADIDRASHGVPGQRPAAPAPASAVAPAPPARTPPRASPLARRRAAEAGLDLAVIPGSGPGGAVTAADVETAAGDSPQPPAESRTGTEGARSAVAPARDQRRMRSAIGALMARSKREIPHYYLATTIDLRSAMGWLRGHNAEQAVADRVLAAALLLRATALAAAAYPDLNGHLVDGTFRPAPNVRLGVSISLRGGGLVTPAIEAAENLGVDELNRRLRDLATRAKAGRLRGSEIVEPSLTVTSLGDRGVEVVYGVIYPPQVALVGFGGIVERPWAAEGMLGVRPVVTATLAADHRASDGHRGAQFLDAVAEHLSHPEDL